MISWFKKHFVPHTGNQHRPHFLRTKNTRTVLLGVLAFELILFLLPTLMYVKWTAKINVAEVLPNVLSELTNQEREQNHLSTLAVSPLLTEAAQMKAQDMAANQYFAHISPQGKTPWYWLGQVGYQYEYAGENLAINFTDSADVTEAWMNSPTHRANIVKGVYTEIGTGIAYGMYQGHSTIYVVQMYANPRVVYTPPNETRLAAVTVPKSTQTPVLRVTATQTTSKTEPGAEVLGTTSPHKSDTNTDANGSNQNSTQPDSGQNPQQMNVPGQNNQNQPLALEKILTAPRHTTNFAFFTLLAVVLAALVLKFSINFDVLHMDLLTNGIFVTTVVVAMLLVNSYIGTRNLQINSGVDYSHAQVISGSVVDIE